MFRHGAAVEAGVIEQGDPHGDHVGLIPLSHLSLDLPVPATGWLAELERRGIEVLDDDLGRPSVARGAVRMLIAEERQREQLRRDKAAAAEKAAVAADEQFRARLWAGVRADRMPSDARPSDVMLAAAKDALPRRRSVLEEALANDSGMTFHSLAPTSDEE
jgi:hypothetical protein